MTVCKILSSQYQRRVRRFRLLDAAETLVTLQTSDLGASNNPLFGSSNQQVHPLYQFWLGTFVYFWCSL